MLVLGRLSVRIVSPSSNSAGPLPMLLTVTVHVQFSPSSALPPVSLVLSGSRSDAVTVTVSAQSLLASFDSGTFRPGSTRQMFEGLAKVPAAVGVARKDTLNEPVEAPSVTSAPEAVQVSVLVAMAQLMLVELVTLTKVPTVTGPSPML